MSGGGGTGWGAPAVITTSVLWGTTGVASVLIPQENPVAVGAASVGIGGLILGLCSLRAIRATFAAPGAARFILLGALGLVLYMPLFYVSVALTGAALGTIISIGSGPLFAGLLEWFIDGKRVGKTWTVAMVITVAGAGLLLSAREMTGGAPAQTSDGLVPGLAAGLVAGMTYAFYAFAIGRLIRPAIARPNGLAHRSVVASIQATAAVPMLGLLAITGEQTLSPQVWPALLYLAVIPTALGHTMFAFGLGRMNASTATLITVLEPVVATVLAVLVLGESFRIEGWLGFPMVVLGLILVSIPRPAGKTYLNRAVGEDMPDTSPASEGARV